MSLYTEPSVESVPRTASGFKADLDRLWAGLPRLATTALNSEVVSRLGDHSSALRFLLHADAARPILAGLVGGASCGKSTLFGSLVGRRLSRIHYQPHSSLGPIIYLHRRHRTSVWPDSPPRRFLPDWEAQELAPSSGGVVGSVGSVCFAFHDEQAWRGIAIMDLPDITSESSRREGWLVRRLIPWMDLVVWMVDPNDYLFEDLYIDLIEEHASLGQRSIVVVNDIHGQADRTNAVLRERVGRFRADDWFLMPPLKCSERDPYPLFTDQPEFARLRHFLSGYRAVRPTRPLAARVRQDAAALLHENTEWARRSRELATALTRLVARESKRIVASAPLMSVLPPAAQQEIEHLRNRLSVWHQGKRLYRAIRHPARAMGQAAFSKLKLTDRDLDTELLYRHLVGSLKECGVEMHRAYLESRLVAHVQEQAPAAETLGVLDPESLDFKPQLDDVARHVFHGAQELLDDPSLWKDKRFHFVASTTGVAVVFFLVEATLGVPGVSLLFTKGLAAAVGLLSPELARYLPLDRMSRLAFEAREMLGQVVQQQMQKMATFYTESHGMFLPADDPLMNLLARVQSASE